MLKIWAYTFFCSLKIHKKIFIRYLDNFIFICYTKIARYLNKIKIYLHNLQILK